MYIEGPRGEGPAKEKSTDPLVHLLHPRPTHLSKKKFKNFNSVRELKNTTGILLQNVHVENFFLFVEMSVFPRFFFSSVDGI
jgi:hypothetical protein